MKAVVLREFGGPEVLRLEDVATPTPAEGQVLIQVHAVSVNRTLDLQVRKDGGNYGVTLPLVLGVDPSGVVVETGPDVERPKVGERVTTFPFYPCGRCPNCRVGKQCELSRMIGVHSWGGYAEYMLAPAANCIPIPDGVDFAATTVISRHFPTAMSEVRKADLKSGDWALIMGASGGLGSCLVQLVRMNGARVIAAAGADERVEAALSLGAEFGVNYRKQKLSEEVKGLTDGRGVDVVFDNIGDPILWEEAYACLAPDGKLVTAGAHGGGMVTLDVRRLYQRRLSVIGGIGLETRDDFRYALELAAAGKVQALIDSILPLVEAPAAHVLVDQNQTVGKVLLDPSLS